MVKGDTNIECQIWNGIIIYFVVMNMNVEFAEEDNKKIYLNQQITLVGWISYKEFWRICRLKNKGETTGSNKMKVRETMYNVSHNHLKSIKSLIKELELE